MLKRPRPEEWAPIPGPHRPAPRYSTTTPTTPARGPAFQETTPEFHASVTVPRTITGRAAHGSAEDMRFDHYEKHIMSQLDSKKYNAKPTSTKWLEGAVDLAFEFEGIFDEIAQRSPFNSSYDTKRNAVQTMYNVLNALAWNPIHTLPGHVAVQSRGLDTTFAAVLSRFSDEEMDQLFLDVGEDWVDGVKTLCCWAEMNTSGAFPDMPDALHWIQRRDEESEEAEEQD